MEWLNENRLKVEMTKAPKRLTGTRFASILGLDRWNTPFKTWCAITRTYEEPFVDNKYTIAGKTIEPLIIDYLNKVYYFGELRTPTDIYGKDYFKKTWGNFFPNEKIFGGMWDALHYVDDKPVAVIEIKTTSRPEDWRDGAPINYALQGALYAYLLGLDDVVMVVAFLEPEDYDNPQDFVPSATNVVIDDFKISERYPQFQAHVDRAEAWWSEHVVKTVSPTYDEKKDEDILKELRKNVLTTEKDIAKLVKEGEKLKTQLAKAAEKTSTKEKRLKEITAILKDHCMGQFREGDTRVAITGSTYEWVLLRTEGTDIDKAALKKDGLLDKYTKAKVGYRFTQTLIKEDTA